MEKSETSTASFTKKLATEIENTDWYLWIAEDLLETNKKKNKTVSLKVSSENKVNALSIKKLEHAVNIALSDGATFEILQSMMRSLLIRSKNAIKMYEEEVKVS